jgi:superfamily I DNA/RNA helicase
MAFLDRMRISLAGRWHWARVAGFGTPISGVSRYTGGQAPDPWQRYAVVSPSEELCCVAGAGSGKTTVLTARIAFLMDRCEVAPSRIRAVTFMKKATMEMEERVHRICPGTGMPMISTIHSLCYGEILKLPHTVRIASLTRWWSSPDAQDLRREATQGALSDAYRAAGGAGEKASARDIVFELGRDLESLESARVNLEPARLVSQTERIGQPVSIEGLKRIALSPYELLERAPVRSDRAEAERLLKSFYVQALTQYHEFKQRQNTVDFNDLLERAAMRLIEDAGLRREIQRRYDHLLIDEYQDTSPIQILILEYLMRGPETSLFVVGDDWQSICGFQDADPRWLVQFGMRHPRARRVVLGTNYRSCQPVVEASTGVMRRHLPLTRLANKRVRSIRPASQSQVEKILLDEAEEADRMVEAVRRQLGTTNDQKRRAFVLARSNGWLSRLARAFEGSGLSYELRDETYSRAPIGQMAEEDEGEEEARARVILTTIHRAKGLEADFVHVAGLADFLLPSRFRDTLIDRVRKRREEDHLAEELRVLYVGMTRAKEALTLWIPCWSGRKQPSRFLPPDNRWCRTTTLVQSQHGADRRRNTRGRPRPGHR